uniref:Ig-like domain-containing protein n=1 Tax=Gouania willdenowi TaxID=441366 RepID=A0A8C5ND14_GOUWI
TMTCAHFVLSLICLLSIETCQSSSSSLYQERRLISVNVGDSVTLQCFYDDDDDASLIFWYKQPLGKQPMIISTYHKYKKEGTFHDEFMNYTRLTLNMRNNTLYLKISDVKASDSATYYCLKYSYQFKMQFSEGTTVVVKDANSFINALVQQSDSETIHPGESVTLNCTASTGSCDGEPSVYWFKNSEDHHSSLIYTQSDNSDQCERKTNKTHTCVYNLSLNNLDQSNAGTYYCAVTSLNCTVFTGGCWDQLSVKESKIPHENRTPQCLRIPRSNRHTCLYNKMIKGKDHINAEFNFCAIASCGHELFRNTTVFFVEGEKLLSCYILTYFEEILHYAALNVIQVSKTGRKRNITKTECVYSTVKN